MMLVRTGTSKTSFLKPKYEPTSTSGSEMPNQSSTSAHMVENGTAVEAPWYQSMMSRVKKTMKTTEGKSVAVRIVLRFQALPPKSLYLIGGDGDGDGDGDGGGGGGG